LFVTKFLVFILLLCTGVVQGNQNSRTRIVISVLTPGEVRVEAELLSPGRSWSFRNAYAGVLGIAERVDAFRATDDTGQDVQVKKIATGEFRSDRDANRISYAIKLTAPDAGAVSHVSWLAADQGFLMFADLLPVDIESATAEFKLPSGWNIESSLTPDANGRYEVSAPPKTVFFIGRSIRKTSKSVDGMTLAVVVGGTWFFKDSDALNAASIVLKKYQALTGFRLPGKPVIMIAPLPVAVGSIKWRAETRGSTVVLLMEPAAGFATWKGQLGVIFTHELLHLWVPNSLQLEGDYDWFFEGFTLYTALRTALELKIINFKEFLDTLARVYDSYLSYPDNLSLIDASERRWTSPGAFVYDKGMLVAFLYDLMIRKESGNKTTLADRYRDLFNGGVADHAQGNEAIIRLLGSSPAVSDFTRSYIETSKELELEQVLLAYGLQLDATGQSSQLTVSRNVNADQKRLLRTLGYRH
jgi:hypothetical protein